jgi:acyl dehydratase
MKSRDVAAEAAPTTLASAEAILSAVGTRLGPGPWTPITQERIDTFADATDDHQWIHVDPVRAKAGPFGAPIAHGYLNL